MGAPPLLENETLWIEARAFLKGFNDCINCKLLHKRGSMLGSADWTTAREWRGLLVQVAGSERGGLRGGNISYL